MTDVPLPNDLFDCHALIEKLKFEGGLLRKVIDDNRDLINFMRNAYKALACNAYKAEQELAALILAVRNEDLEAVNKFLNKHNTNVYVE